MCTTNDDCADDEECVVNTKNIPQCRKVCEDQPCGRQTFCKGLLHKAVCSCRDGFFGDPKKGCIKKECTTDTECTDDKYCEKNMCKIACLAGNPCGDNTVCSSEKHTQKCYCQPGYTGDPKIGCVKLDYCSTNPCGNGAVCRNSRNRAQCVCPPGTVGDPYKDGCRRAQECRSNRDCPSIAQCSLIDGIRKCTGNFISR